MTKAKLPHRDVGSDDTRQESVVLDDSRVVTVRTIRPGDLEELRRAIRDADPDTLRMRFLGGRPPRNDAELKRLVDVDHAAREAFVAFAPDGRGVGIARYDQLDQTSADVAVAVDPDWRRVGLATALLTRLVRAALRNGIDRIHADYFAANEDVADLLRRAGDRQVQQLEQGVVEEIVQVDQDLLAADPTTASS